MDPRVAQPGHNTNHSFRIIPYNYNCGSEVAKCCWKTSLSQVTVSMHTVYSWEDASTRVKSVLSLHTNEPRIKVNKNNSGVKIMTLLRRIDAINCIWWHKMNFCKALDHFQTSFESPTLFCPCSLWNRNPETWMPSVWLFDKQNLFRMFSRDRMTWLRVDLGILYVIKN